MIRWCAYCQKFLGETPPYENKSFSHGICTACEGIGLTASDSQLSRMKYLVDLNSRFWTAGAGEKHDEIVKLAEEGILAGIRPIDILFGFAAPMLFRVGDMWERGILDPEEEARFTRTVETLIDLIAKRIHLNEADRDTNSYAPVLLANVFGNQHTLGLKFARIGMASLGFPATIVLPTVEPFALVAKAVSESFQVVSLSIALQSQYEALEETLSAFEAEQRFCGKIVVGGAGVTKDLTDANHHPAVHFLLSASFDESERLIWKVEKRNKSKL